MSTFARNEALIPIEPGQAVSPGWTSATDNRPVGVTWHWTVTNTLKLCREVLGGANAERKGEASAHYGIGLSFAEGVDRYVSLNDRSWHAGINQTIRWDGQALTDGRFKGSRTTIGVETVNMGFARDGLPPAPDWTTCAEPNGKHVMQVKPWTQEQVAMMIEIGKEIVDRWPLIQHRDHHGHHDICPGYKQDVGGFPFATVLRRIYEKEIPDVWTPLWTPRQRQEALAKLKYDLGKTGVDGYWGRNSDAALRLFQRQHGMLENGMWTTFVNWAVYDEYKRQAISFADW